MTFSIKKNYFNYFVNFTFKKGKKNKIIFIFLLVFKKLRIKGKQPFVVFEQAVINVIPPIIFDQIRQRNRVINKPKILSKDNQFKVGVKWIIKGALLKKNRKSFSYNFSQEIINAASFEGGAFEKKIKIINIIEIKDFKK